MEVIQAIVTLRNARRDAQTRDIPDEKLGADVITRDRRRVDPAALDSARRTLAGVSGLQVVEVMLADQSGLLEFVR